MVKDKLVFGTNLFHYSTSEKTSHRLLSQISELGIRNIDTSSSYSLGESEKYLGNWLLKSSQPRESIFLTTKVGLLPGQESRGSATKSKIIESLNGSLARLKTDYVDTLLLHVPDKRTPIAESLEAFYELIDRGLIRGFGICNASAEFAETLANSIQSTRVGSGLVIQNYFNWAKRDRYYWEDFRARVRLHPVKTMSYGIFARGILASNEISVASESRKLKNPTIKLENENLQNKQNIALVVKILQDLNLDLYSFSVWYGSFFSDFSIFALRNMTQLNSMSNYLSSVQDNQIYLHALEKIEQEELVFRGELGDPGMG